MRQSLVKIEHEEVKVEIIHSSVGNINESDILLASASNAVVLGFNVKVDPQTARMAEAEHVEIRTYNVIYELTKEVRAAMGGLLSPVFEEEKLARPRSGRLSRCRVRALWPAAMLPRESSAQRTDQGLQRRPGSLRGQARFAEAHQGRGPRDGPGLRVWDISPRVSTISRWAISSKRLRKANSKSDAKGPRELDRPFR